MARAIREADAHDSRGRSAAAGRGAARGFGATGASVDPGASTSAAGAATIAYLIERIHRAQRTSATAATAPPVRTEHHLLRDGGHRLVAVRADGARVEVTVLREAVEAAELAERTSDHRRHGEHTPRRRVEIAFGIAEPDLRAALDAVPPVDAARRAGAPRR